MRCDRPCWQMMPTMCHLSKFRVSWEERCSPSALEGRKEGRQVQVHAHLASGASFLEQVPVFNAIQRQGEKPRERGALPLPLSISERTLGKARSYRRPRPCIWSSFLVLFLCMSHGLPQAWPRSTTPPEDTASRPGHHLGSSLPCQDLLSKTLPPSCLPAIWTPVGEGQGRDSHTSHL